LVTAFRNRVQLDEEMPGYLARLVALTIEGQVTVHLLQVLWGEGANGKITFISALEAAYSGSREGYKPYRGFRSSRQRSYSASGSWS
jgi:hypothetical protein